jgi:dTDP-D-glucose 4,6-dehydratase
MRFDLVVNDLAALAWTERAIRMTSDGTPWRPFVHVLDICQAMALVLEAPADAVGGLTLNVGSSSENYRIRDVAEAIGRVVPDCETSFGDSTGDHRNYRVSFDRIAAVLPAFRPAWTVERGAVQLVEVFRAVDMTAEQYRSPAYTRLRQMRHLLATGQVDATFRWNVAPGSDRAPERDAAASDTGASLAGGVA